MYHDYLREGLITAEEPLKPSYDIVHLTADELIRIRDRAQRQYPVTRLRQLLSPSVFMKELLPKINTWEKFSLLLRRAIL
jgi:hypothetical protein